MHRSLKWFLCVLAVSLWCANGLMAAEGGAKPPKPPQPAAPPAAQAPQPAQPAQDAPSIQIPELTFDFGEINEGTEVTHEFAVKNTGKGALQIEQVRPG
jgi:hypothetical protein